MPTASINQTAPQLVKPNFLYGSNSEGITQPAESDSEAPSEYTDTRTPLSPSKTLGSDCLSNVQNELEYKTLHLVVTRQGCMKIEHLRALVSHALPQITVKAVTYPQFETRGDLGNCVSRFREWLVDTAAP
ncbi:MAG: hypothetical protein Q9211_005542, partial [Gyalolechia sp. 1 TL-2023]